MAAQELPDDGVKDLERSFERFYRVHLTAARALAFQMTRDFDGAKDCVHDAFLQIRKDWPTISTYDKPHATLMKYVKFRAIDSLRKRQHVEPCGIREDLAKSVPIFRADDDLSLELREALRSIDQDAAQVVLLFAYGWKTPEIAAILGLSESTVFRLRKRGLKELNLYLTGANMGLGDGLE